MSDEAPILRALAIGGGRAAAELLPLVYGELRCLAVQRLAQERPGHTLQPTALVHEAYLRLLGNDERLWSDHSHFYRAAAEAMRRILIDHARAKKGARRGGDRRAIPLDLVELAAESSGEEILAVAEAISRLEEENADVAEIVRLRFYVGLSVEETARAMGVSERTVYRDWTYARAWLIRHLGDVGAGSRPTGGRTS
jgi:RNA polymerase sigma factor (TIGR02999 family)